MRYFGQVSSYKMRILINRERTTSESILRDDTATLFFIVMYIELICVLQIKCCDANCPGFIPCSPHSVNGDKIFEDVGR